MLDLVVYLIKQGKATQEVLFPQQDDAASGLPRLDADKLCLGTTCSACVEICPTRAIDIHSDSNDKAKVLLDLGSCIGCGLCIATCPTGVFVKDSSTTTAVNDIDRLTISNLKETRPTPPKDVSTKAPKLFRQSLAVRVVSTGCSACDLEIGAAGNPIFDMERFGIQVVASPRMADALIITGPVGKGMQDAIRRTYEAMAEPRIVIACGSCAITGGVHRNSYAGTNGLGAILPVDVFIPGCPPHPWSIIHGIFLAMGKTIP